MPSASYFRLEWENSKLKNSTSFAKVKAVEKAIADKEKIIASAKEEAMNKEGIFLFLSGVQYARPIGRLGTVCAFKFGHQQLFGVRGIQ